LNLLQDIITYVRRIIKSPSDAVITDNLIIDYINRFWIMDVDARVQLFDLKTKYQFVTTPAVDRYNMPLYSLQVEPGAQNIGMYPVYQGFLAPAYIQGVEVYFQTQKQSIYNAWPNVVQQQNVVGVGDGTRGPYTLNFPIGPGPQPVPLNPPLNGIVRGHVDITGIIGLSSIGGGNIDPPVCPDAATLINQLGVIPTTSIDSAVFITATAADGSNIIAQDSGIFLQGNTNYGLLIEPGSAPFGHSILNSGGYSTTSNTINYLTGTAVVTFNESVPVGSNINVQCYFFQGGLPRSILFYNNVLTLRSPPAFSYVVEIDAYLSPAAFLNTASAIPFGYMAEYIARGAARKILSDTGDVEQFQFYEPLFNEQEQLVWKRSQRIWTATRTQTIYSQGNGQNQGWGGINGGGVT
jgi:hypothetical protein